MIPLTWHNNTINIPILNNSGCLYPVDGEVRYMVCARGVPCLDYPLDVLISWSRRLSLYNWFCLHAHMTYTVHTCIHKSVLTWFHLHLLFTTCLFWEHMIYWYFLFTCICFCARHLAFLCTRWVASWQAWIACPNIGVLEYQRNIRVRSESIAGLRIRTWRKLENV